MLPNSVVPVRGHQDPFRKNFYSFLPRCVTCDIKVSSPVSAPLLVGVLHGGPEEPKRKGSLKDPSMAQCKVVLPPRSVPPFGGPGTPSCH